jgi:hypothetical protein
MTFNLPIQPLGQKDLAKHNIPKVFFLTKHMNCSKLYITESFEGFRCT